MSTDLREQNFFNDLFTLLLFLYHYAIWVQLPIAIISLFCSNAKIISFWYVVFFSVKYKLLWGNKYSTGLGGALAGMYLSGVNLIVMIVLLLLSFSPVGPINIPFPLSLLVWFDNGVTIFYLVSFYFIWK